LNNPENGFLPLISDGIDVGYIVGQQRQPHLLNQRAGSSQVHASAHGITPAKKDSNRSYLTFVQPVCHTKRFAISLIFLAKPSFLDLASVPETGNR
jgi:hypothetical protein